MSDTRRPWRAADPVPPDAGSRLRIFALSAAERLGTRVAEQLGVPLARHEEREFEDGEHKARPLDPVQGCDVYVLQGLHGDGAGGPNDRLCRLLFFIGAVKDAGAARVTAVVPYLCYARKDRRTKPSDPVTTRYVAALLEAVGADAVVTLEVHNPAAFQNAFRCRTVALSAAPILADHVGTLGPGPYSVVSPDTGGAKRAELFRERLEALTGRPAGKAFCDKHRSGGVVTGDLFVGEVAGTMALVVDDLISTGGTLLRAAHAARRAGATGVVTLVAHGLFMRGAEDALADPAIDRLVLLDTVPVPASLPDGVRRKIDVLPSAPLLATAIARLCSGSAFDELGVV